jgi:hypothetical protein
MRTWCVSGWTAAETEAELLVLGRLGLRRDEEAERTLSRDHLILVTNADSSPASSTQSRSGCLRTNRERTSAQRLFRQSGTEAFSDPFYADVVRRKRFYSQRPSCRFTLIGTRRGKLSR